MGRPVAGFLRYTRGGFFNRLGRWPEDRFVVAFPGRCPGLDNRLALRAEKQGAAKQGRCETRALRC